ncbi:hypothetical protein TNCV_2395481 [Trichonephila clavipes]|nr:hypothetical protein TNCV_2395481 [Trichonephila clavipes]
MENMPASQVLPSIFFKLGKYVFGVSQALPYPPRAGSCGGVRYATAMYLYTLQVVLFICYKQSPKTTPSVAFSERTHWIEDETFNGRDTIDKWMDYEDVHKKNRIL